MSKTAPISTEQLTHLAYRKDIDGIRAIAVLLVVIFHAFPSVLPGGFVGVDVFFVISGFLISSILLKSLSAGLFSFRDFYARRVLRIFPALIAVSLFCLALGWMSLLGDEFKQLGLHLIGGAGFASNFLLWNEAGYFDAAAEFKPLLHLWSLGIEEQFYIVWPVLLFLAWRAGLNVITVATLCIAGSLTWSVSLRHIDPVFAFYLPGTRAWELLAGFGLAYASLSKNPLLAAVRGRLDRVLATAIFAAPPQRPGATLSNVKSLIGIAAIAWPAYFLSKGHAFPGYWAILPVVGAVMLISSGPNAWINRVVLSNRLAVFVGRISFPLYLWHWPLLSFPAIMGQESPSLKTRIIAVLLSFVFAWGTLVLIENPIRFGRRRRAKVAGLTGGMALVAVLGYATWTGKIEPYSSTLGLDNIAAASEDWTFPEPAYTPFRVNEQREIDFYTLKGGADRATLFVGDSNMQQYSARIERILAEEGSGLRTAIIATVSGCPPIPNIIRDDNPSCPFFMPLVKEQAARPDVESVVFAANWFFYFTGSHYRYTDASFSGSIGASPEAAERAYQALESTIREVVANNKKVYLVLNIPVGKEMDPKAMVKRSVSRLGFKIRKAGVKREDLMRHYGAVHARLTEIATQSGATIIDPVVDMCNDVSCPSVLPSGDPIYRDGAHLRATYVREHVTYLDRTLKLD